MTTTAPVVTTTAPRPALVTPVLAFAALTIAYVVANKSTPHPDASAVDVLHYALAHSGGMKVGAFLLFSSAVPLAAAAAMLNRRIRDLGSHTPGSVIALIGGILASSALTFSALTMWAGARLSDVADPALARALADLGFMSGGPAYAVGFALLVAGVSVTGLLGGLLPRALTVTGLVIAIAGVLATLALVVPGFAYLLPAVRFGGLLWLVVVAFMLPTARRTAV